jgi:F-type H+-transporting ATPase subunit b
MADSAHTTEPSHDLTTTQAHAEHGHNEHEAVNPMEISGQMVLWTWIVFAVMMVVLYKLAWKPILGALDQREKDIQDSIDNAETVRKELEGIEEVRQKTVAEADDKAKSVLDAARKGAQEQARHIEGKAREQAQILSENANREIETARAKAEASLKAESGAWARELAGKLIDANLDDKKNQALTDKLIQEL